MTEPCTLVHNTMVQWKWNLGCKGIRNRGGRDSIFGTGNSLNNPYQGARKSLPANVRTLTGLPDDLWGHRDKSSWGKPPIPDIALAGSKALVGGMCKHFCLSGRAADSSTIYYSCGDSQSYQYTYAKSYNNNGVLVYNEQYIDLTDCTGC